MSSEERIRTEVHRMADGIQVASERRLAAVLAKRSRRRRWVPVASAASVVAVVASGVVLSGVLSGDRSGPGPVESAEPSEGTPDGTVPSLFGHTRDSADALLADLGLKVRFGEQDSCEPEGRPVGTEPAAGTPVETGDEVTVLLAFQGPLTDCAFIPTEAWAFVDFATGRGPAPVFADEVELYVDGERTRRLSAEVARSGDWGEGSALGILEAATREVFWDGDEYQTPTLRAVGGTPPDAWCGVAKPREVGDREALTLTIAIGEQACPARISVYEVAGAIDAVLAWPGSSGSAAPAPIPDVVGLGLVEARDLVTAAGYAARVEELETCNPREGVVVEQAPSQQDIEDDRKDEPPWSGPVTLVVEVAHSTRDCAGLDRAVADFLAFARGGKPPAWAPEVRQLLGYALWDKVSANRADEPAAWSFCSGVAPEDCSLSPLAVAGRDVDVATGEYVDVSRWPAGEGCNQVDRGGLPADLSPDRQIVLYPAELASCDDEWSVWLWVDDSGRIEAVNLLVPQGQ